MNSSQLIIQNKSQTPWSIDFDGGLHNLALDSNLQLQLLMISIH